MFNSTDSWLWYDVCWYMHWYLSYIPIIIKSNVWVGNKALCALREPPRPSNRANCRTPILCPRIISKTKVGTLWFYNFPQIINFMPCLSLKRSLITNGWYRGGWVCSHWWLSKVGEVWECCENPAMGSTSSGFTNACYQWRILWVVHVFNAFSEYS